MGMPIVWVGRRSAAAGRDAGCFASTWVVAGGRLPVTERRNHYGFVIIGAIMPGGHIRHTRNTLGLSDFRSQARQTAVIS